MDLPQEDQIHHGIQYVVLMG